MPSRSFLSSAAILATLLTTTALSPSAAWAQKAAALSPVTAWAITKVAGDDGVGGYCAVARRFTKNTIVTVARNQQDEASIALDFQAPRLQPGVDVSVTLDAGSGEERSYEIAPVSEKAVVVRLGRDDEFFAALQETGLLRVEVNGDHYSFNLADIDNGQSRLSDCLVSLTEPAAGEAGGGIQEEIASMKQDIQGLRSENKRLSGIVGKSDNMRALNEPEAHDSLVHEEMTRTASRLEGENDILRRQTKKTGVSTGDMSPGMLGDLQKQNKQLQNALFSMKIDRGDVGGKGQKIAGMVRENVSAQSEYGKASKPKGWSNAAAETYNLKQENQRLQNMLARQTGEIRLAQNMQERVETLQQQNEMLQNGAQSSPEELKKRVEDLAAQVAEKDRKLVELSAMSAEAKSLRAKNAELEQRLMSNSGDTSGVEALNTRIKSLEEENNRLIGEVQKATSGGSEAEKIAALTKENEQLKAEIASLKRGSTDNSAVTVELDKLRTENAELRNQLQASKAENKSLKDRIAGLMKSAKEAVVGSEEPQAKPQDITAQEPQAEVMAEPMSEPMPVEPVDHTLTEAQKQEAMMRNNMGNQPQQRPLQARMSDDPYEGMSPEENLKSAQQSESIAWNNAVVQQAPQSAQSIYNPKLSVSSILTQASIATTDGVKMVPKASDSRRVAWQWKTGEVYGSAEQYPMVDMSMFDSGVEGYLTKTRSRCAGEFAAEPDSSVRTGALRIDTYEIACVGKGVNSAAALMFIGKDSSFTAMAHETPANKMNAAMEIRDRLLKLISGS